MAAIGDERGNFHGGKRGTLKQSHLQLTLMKMEEIMRAHEERFKKMENHIAHLEATNKKVIQNMESLMMREGKWPSESSSSFSTVISPSSSPSSLSNTILAIASSQPFVNQSVSSPCGSNISPNVFSSTTASCETYSDSGFRSISSLPHEGQSSANDQFTSSTIPFRASTNSNLHFTSLSSATSSIHSSAVNSYSFFNCNILPEGISSTSPSSPPYSDSFLDSVFDSNCRPNSVSSEPNFSSFSQNSLSLFSSSTSYSSNTLPSAIDSYYCSSEDSFPRRDFPWAHFSRPSSPRASNYNSSSNHRFSASSTDPFLPYFSRSCPSLNAISSEPSVSYVSCTSNYNPLPSTHSWEKSSSNTSASSHRFTKSSLSNNDIDETESSSCTDIAPEKSIPHNKLNPLGEELLAASKHGRLDNVRKIISGGANVNYHDVGGRTPLHWAAFNAHADTVSLLLEMGAIVHAKDSMARTPLHLAVGDLTGRCVSLLVDAGADVHCRDSMGDAPLHPAARLGSEEAVKLLLAAGARKHVQDIDGKTPFDVAVGDYLRKILKH